MSIQVSHSIEMAPITCGVCGITYCIPERFRAQHEQKGTSWNCPGCGVGWGYSEGEVDRLKKKLAQERKNTERARENAARERSKAEAAERSRRATKGALTKVKNRVACGVCPCCKRSFKNLARHMKSKHPDYAESAK